MRLGAPFAAVLLLTGLAAAAATAQSGGIGIDPRTGAPMLLEEPASEPAREPERPAAPPEPRPEAETQIRSESAPETIETGRVGPRDGFTLDDLNIDGLDAVGRRSAIPEGEPAPPVRGVRVVLRGLDKLTGDLGEAEAAVGETATLWRLEIDVKACYARPEASASAGSAFVQIRDMKPDPAETVFSGWMFAASPALSAMDHPRYDVWVLSCKTS